MARMTGSIGFHPHIVDLISNEERQCMLHLPRGGFDLHDWHSVAPRTEIIIKHLRRIDGFPVMPPPNGWPEAKIQLFEKWAQEGSPAQTGEVYAAFFRELDAYTEYFDTYGVELGLEDLGPYYSRIWGPGLLLQKEWLSYFETKATTPILRAQKERQWGKVLELTSREDISEAIIKIDGVICDLMEKHFLDASEQFNVPACLDAFRRFGEDILPSDEDRKQRVINLGNLSDRRLVSDFAPYHRMDTRKLWFFWFGHLQCANAILGSTDKRAFLRKALAASIFIGQVSDTAFREGSNRQTRSEYLNDRTTVWQSATTLAEDFELASNEIQELYYIWSASQKPLFVA